MYFTTQILLIIVVASTLYLTGGKSDDNVETVLALDRCRHNSLVVELELDRTRQAMEQLESQVVSLTDQVSLQSSGPAPLPESEAVRYLLETIDNLKDHRRLDAEVLKNCKKVRDTLQHLVLQNDLRIAAERRASCRAKRSAQIIESWSQAAQENCTSELQDLREQLHSYAESYQSFENDNRFYNRRYRNIKDREFYLECVVALSGVMMLVLCLFYYKASEKTNQFEKKYEDLKERYRQQQEEIVREQNRRMRDEVQVQVQAPYKPEGMMVGKPLKPKLRSQGQATIMVTRNGVQCVLGEAFFVSGYCITAKHVFSMVDEDEIISITTSFGDKVRMLEKPMNWFKDTNTGHDVMFAVVSNSDLQKLELKKLKIETSNTTRMPVTVAVGGRGSDGWARVEGVGNIVYDGSTTEGFSGAPYLSGSGKVFGMHLGTISAQTGQAGYHINFILLLIENCCQVTRVLESPWLIERLREQYESGLSGGQPIHALMLNSDDMIISFTNRGERHQMRMNIDYLTENGIDVDEFEFDNVYDNEKGYDYMDPDFERKQSRKMKRFYKGESAFRRKYRGETAFSDDQPKDIPLDEQQIRQTLAASKNFRVPVKTGDVEVLGKPEIVASAPTPNTLEDPRQMILTLERIIQRMDGQESTLVQQSRVLQSIQDSLKASKTPASAPKSSKKPLTQPTTS